MECFRGYFLQYFYQETSKFDYWVDGWELAIESKHFRSFLEISLFPVECLTADFLQFFTKIRLNLAIVYSLDGLEVAIKSKHFRNFLEISLFPVECFKADLFAIFYQEASILGYWVDGWELAIKSKHFGNFLEIS